jgi:type VI secretion system protein ImpK
MSRNISRNQPDTFVNIDSMLQDTYLLVVELRQGGSAQNSMELWKLCANQIDTVRKQLKSAGLSQRNIDHVSHAQCALLDETVLGYAEGEAHAKWASEPLQAKFFSRHQAGEFLYEDMREVLREPAPDVRVLTVFERILMLGFQGCYRDANDPERLQILRALTKYVAPLEPSHSPVTVAGRTRRFGRARWTRSRLSHLFVVGALLVGVWWSLDYSLDGVIALLLPGQS